MEHVEEEPRDVPHSERDEPTTTGTQLEQLEYESQLMERIASLQGRVQEMQKNAIRHRQARAEENISRGLAEMGETAKELKKKTGRYAWCCYPCCVIGKCMWRYGKPTALFIVISTLWLVIFVGMLFGIAVWNAPDIQTFQRRT